MCAIKESFDSLLQRWLEMRQCQEFLHLGPQDNSFVAMMTEIVDLASRDLMLRVFAGLAAKEEDSGAGANR